MNDRLVYIVLMDLGLKIKLNIQLNASKPHTTNKRVDHLFRTESGRMTAILTRIFGFEHSRLVEDIVQETFLTALKSWPLKGQPENPSAWLMQVAKNKTINAVKRKNRRTEWNPRVIQEVEKIDRLFLDREIKDSQLRMIFACCYPELSQKSQIILVLNTLCGFNNAEIASALLMTTDAVKKSIYRAKKDVQKMYNDISAPILREAKKRLKTVYTVIYLMFSEGYKSTYGNKIINEDLCFEAVRLAKLLLEIPDINHGETHALLSLMYFNISRFPARREKNREIIELKLQDRSSWDKDCIHAGFYHLKQSRQSDSLCKFHLESSIAAVHSTAESYEETDWNKILFYYQKLLLLEDNAIIRLNCAIALSKVEGPNSGLKMLDGIELQSLKDKEYLLFAAKAEMNAELGNYEMAKSYYRVACDNAHTKTDQLFLKSKIEACDRKNLSKN